MANKFYAATDIKHGRFIEDGSQDGKHEVINIAAGEEVTGFSAEEMKSLWRAGALTQTPPVSEDQHGEFDDAPPADETSTPAKATPAKATAKSTDNK